MLSRIAACALVLCAVGGPSAAQGGPARLQVIHNAPDPDVPTVDVYVGGGLVVDDLAFREGTPFFDLPADTLVFQVTAADAPDALDPLLEVEYVFEPGQAYQLIATGVLGDDFTLLAAGAVEGPANPSFVAVRVVQGVPDLPPVILRAGGQEFLGNVAYRDVSPYFEVPPAVVAVDLVTAADGTPIGTYSVDIEEAAGGAATILASGYLTPSGGQPAFGVLIVFADGTETLLGLATLAEGGPDADLSLAVPNPVRGAATVAYEVATSGRARLALHDALGRRVAVLADGPVAAGAHAAPLDASALAAGVYVLRLETGAGSLTRTITVVH